MNNIMRMCQFLVRRAVRLAFCAWFAAAAFVCAPVWAQTPAQSPVPPKPETPYSQAVKAYDQGAFRQAFLSFRELAQMGHGGAEFMLGVMYFYGRGVERDQGVASIWFYKSARQGNPAAQLAFGSMFIRGVGVSPDPVQAYKWLLLARMSGFEDIASQADALLEKLHLGPADQAAAEKAAREFKPVTTGPLGME